MKDKLAALFGWFRRSPRSETDEALTEVAEFKALLAGLTIDVDFSQVTAAIAEVEALKAALADEEPIKLDVDTTGIAAAEAEMAKIRRECSLEHHLYLDGKELQVFRSDS